MTRTKRGRPSKKDISEKYEPSHFTAPRSQVDGLAVKTSVELPSELPVNDVKIDAHDNDKISLDKLDGDKTNVDLQKQLSELLDEVGELSIDGELSQQEVGAVIKMQTFFSILQRVPMELVNKDRVQIIKDLKSFTIDNVDIFIIKIFWIYWQSRVDYPRRDPR